MSSSPIGFISKILIGFIFGVLYLPVLNAEIYPHANSLKKSGTVMLYFNGDNNLTHEVLYALDMVETIGSSGEINIIALCKTWAS